MTLAVTVFDNLTPALQQLYRFLFNHPPPPPCFKLVCMCLARVIIGKEKKIVGCTTIPVLNHLAQELRGMLGFGANFKTSKPPRMPLDSVPILLRPPESIVGHLSAHEQQDWGLGEWKDPELFSPSLPGTNSSNFQGNPTIHQSPHSGSRISTESDNMCPQPISQGPGC